MNVVTDGTCLVLLEFLTLTQDTQETAVIQNIMTTVVTYMVVIAIGTKTVLISECKVATLIPHAVIITVVVMII